MAHNINGGDPGEKVEPVGAAKTDDEAASDALGPSPRLTASEDGLTRAQSSAVESIQATTKWIIGAIGAVAVVVLAGVQISPIGSLHGDAFEDELLWPVLALVGVLVALSSAALVLLGGPVTLGTLLDQGLRFRLLRRKVEADPAMEDVSLTGLKTYREKASKLLDDDEASILKNVQENNTGANSFLKGKLKQETRALSQVEATIEAVEWLARYIRVKARFRVSLLALIPAVALVAVGTLGFLTSTSDAHPAGQVSACSKVSVATVALATDPSPCPSTAIAITKATHVTVRLNQTGVLAYQAGDPQCALKLKPHPDGWAIGGTWASPLVIFTQVNGGSEPPCVNGKPFQVKPSYGWVHPRS
jgi:hypothetical protein